MKIAITADCHLTSLKKHPERYAAVEALFTRLIAVDISQLIIAGDLFDADSRNYADFDALCRRPAFRDIRITVIPGNHDPQLSSRGFSAPNITVIETPVISPCDLMSRPLLFLPYEAGKSMGEAIAAFAADLKGEPWILIGHGDWIGGLREPNPWEPGIYMPLTRADLQSYAPSAVFLGHIHKPALSGPVHYPGSLYPLDINETGRRRFFVLESETGAVTAETIDTGRIFFKADLIALPAADEADYMHHQIEACLQQWGISDKERPSVRIRVKVRGYTADKRQLAGILGAGFSGLEYHDPEGPDLSGVSVSADRDLEMIADMASREILSRTWPSNPDFPLPAEIVHAALKTIYGE